MLTNNVRPHCHDDVVSALKIGVTTGIIGEAASKVLIKGVNTYFSTLTKSQQKHFLSGIGKITNAQLRDIRKTIAKGLTPEILEQLTEKYGYDVVVSAVVSSTTAEALQ